MENTGGTLRVDVSDADAILTLHGIKFELEELHFHWGSDETKGSEHQFNGASFPAEVRCTNYYIIHFVNNRKGAIHTSELDRSEIDLSPKRSECERSNANCDRSKIILNESEHFLKAN